MLGAQSLEQILGTSLMNMVPTEERKACQGFLDRAMGGQRGSFEVDLVGLTGSRHTFELHASAHPGAPDAIASVLISFRDVTESRRLEQSLVEAATRQAEQEAAHDAERKRLQTDIELARKAQTDQFAVDEQLTELERRLAEVQRRARRAARRRTPTRLPACRRRLPTSGVRPTRSRRPLQNSMATTSSSPSCAAATTRSIPNGSSCSRWPACCAARPRRGSRPSPSSPSGWRRSKASGSTRSTPPTRCGSTSTSGTPWSPTSPRGCSCWNPISSRPPRRSAQLQRELESRTSLANELAARIETLEAEPHRCGPRPTPSWQAFGRPARPSNRGSHAGGRRDATARRGRGRTRAMRAAATPSIGVQQGRGETAALRAALEQEHAASRADLESQLQESQTRYGTDTSALRDALNESLSEQARLAEAMAAAEEDATQKGSQLAAVEQTIADERTAHAGRLVELEANAATRLAELELRAERPSAHTRPACRSSSRPTPRSRRRATRPRPPRPRGRPNATPSMPRRSPSWKPRTPPASASSKPPSHRPASVPMMPWQPCSGPRTRLAPNGSGWKTRC